MNLTYENQGTHTYLVYNISEDDVVDTMSLGMLTNNKIPGLAHTLFTQMDAKQFIKYDVSAKISVKQFFTGQVNKKRLIGVFNGIVDAMISAEEYMIDVNSIVLDLDHIFADVSTCETVLICLPVISDDLSKVDLGTFFKNIMFSTQFDQTENCDHVAKIINYLNSSPVFSLEDFKKVLDSLDASDSVQTPQPVVQRPAPQSVQQPVQQPQPQPQYVQPLQAQPQVKVQPPVQTAQKATASPAEQQVSATVQTGQSAASVQQQPVTEKKMSMLDLLKNYSKENVELYKAQKAAKKSGQAVQTPAKPPVQASAPQPKKPQNGFAIPGENAASGKQGFAIPGQQITVKPVVQPSSKPAVQQKPAAPQQQTAQAVKTPVYTAPQMPNVQPMNFGETTVLGGGGIGETTVLGAAPSVQTKPHLIRTKNNERINLDKPVFRIGKEKSYVDYFVGDNSAISRSHANVICRDGEYFVVDTNSTNHTYINGVMIQSNVETKIAHGAKIKLANEDFEFRLY